MIRSALTYISCPDPQKLILVLLPLFYLFVSCGTTPREAEQSSCTEVRAAFDVGSGTTKLTVAKVDLCKKRVQKVLYQKEQPVKYDDSLHRPEPDRPPKLPEAIIQKGQQVLADLKKKATSHNPDAYAGIATSVFRKASNGSQVVKQLQQASGIPIRLISQDREAQLGLIGAMPHVEDPDGTIAVWDIGAGSMQLSVRRSDREARVYRGALGSVPFKRRVIRLTGNDPDHVNSPNPLGILHSMQSYALALLHADRNVPRKIQHALKQLDQPVIGIGGVHVYSIRPQVGEGEAKQYTHKQVVQTLMKRSLLDDEAIGGEYASTEVTNLALVGGMMDALGIERIQVANVNLSDGLLLTDDLWHERKRLNRND